MAKVDEMVLAMAEPIAAEFLCDVVDVEYKKEGEDWCLRVFIDKEGGVNITDCESVNRALSKKLDDEDIIDRAYCFEVCSPGLERELKKEREFLRYIGREVSVKLFAPLNSRKEFVGKLIDYKEETAFIEISDEQVIPVPRKAAASIKLYIEF